MVSTAVMTSREHHRARGERKQAAASIQQAVKVAKSVATYQRDIVQSMDRWVSRALQTRIGSKSERFPCERKNSSA
jgi:hypothetical protein